MSHTPFTVHIIYEDQTILRVNSNGEVRDYPLTFNQLTLLIEQAANVLRAAARRVYHG